MHYAVVVAAFAGQVAWVAKTAALRGRSAAGWALGAASLGVLVFWLGMGLVWLAMSRDASETLSVLAVFAPVVVAFGSTILLVVVIHRLPIKTSSRTRWAVDDLTPGAQGARGRLSIEGETLRVELVGAAQVVPLGALRTVEADGECVRLAWDDAGVPRKVMLLPRGTPDTPEGRRAQSQRIEQQLRGEVPTARVVER